MDVAADHGSNRVGGLDSKMQRQEDQKQKKKEKKTVLLIPLLSGPPEWATLIQGESSFQQM